MTPQRAGWRQADAENRAEATSADNPNPFDNPAGNARLTQTG